MDPVAVDRFTRAFATAGTRRRMMSLLGLLPLAATISLRDSEPVAAGGRKHRRKKRHDPGGEKRNRKGLNGKRNGNVQQAPQPPVECVPRPQSACAEESRVCGSIDDGCGGTLNCGSCDLCQTCNATGKCGADLDQNRTTCAGSGASTSICCNGECCSGCCGSDGSCGACRVFVTSEKYDGNLKGSSISGLAGADTICMTLAESAIPALPGTYKAWLSDSTNSPSTRFRCTAAHCSSQGYVQVDGTTVVANDWDDLTTCSGAESSDCIDHVIDHTENNVRIGAQNNVWTHTNTDGTAGGVGNVHCLDWISNDPGQSGDFAVPAARGVGDASWTRFSSEPCHAAVRLYCFQQL